jgi:WD40 repeat protein
MMNDRIKTCLIVLCLTPVILFTGCSPQKHSTTPTASLSVPGPEPGQPAITSSLVGEIEALYTLGGHRNGVTGFVFLPDNVQIVSISGDRVITRWNARNGTLTDTLTRPGARIHNVAFSRDGSQVAIGNYGRNAVGLLDTQNGQLAQKFKGNRGFIMRVAFSPDSSYLASGDDTGRIVIWNVESGEDLLTFDTNSTIGSLAFSPDSSLLASGNSEGNSDIQLWDLKSGQESLRLSGHTGNVYNLVFTPNGKQLFSSSGDRTIKLWEVESGQLLRTLKGHRDFVYGLAISPDGKLLASASADGMIKLWEVETGLELRTLNSHSQYIYQIAFSPDGSLAASGGEGDSIIIWGIPR